ncbi:hypothetical protein D1AOALGA4SA_6014 [Olavius algarvensis Delta 1 endosymbiont]|nr:hypothetical protein D1AOALGA4SA_6014 [Olavius algarvensis Delta 1 endosymbiont]
MLSILKLDRAERNRQSKIQNLKFYSRLQDCIKSLLQTLHLSQWEASIWRL